MQQKVLSVRKGGNWKIWKTYVTSLLYRVAVLILPKRPYYAIHNQHRSLLSLLKFKFQQLFFPSAGILSLSSFAVMPNHFICISPLSVSSLILETFPDIDAGLYALPKDENVMFSVRIFLKRRPSFWRPSFISAITWRDFNKIGTK